MNPNRFLIVLLIASMSFVLGCGLNETGEKSQTAVSAAPEATAPKVEVILATDQSCSVTKQGGWKETSGLHQKAQLQATNPYGDMYLVVFAEKKDKYAGVTLDDYSEVTRGHIIKALSSPAISRPIQVTIDGNPALQYEIQGYSKNSKIAYIHTAVETPLYFHEIIVWTPADRFQRNHFALESAIKSFKEVQPSSGS